MDSYCDTDAYSICEKGKFLLIVMCKSSLVSSSSTLIFKSERVVPQDGIDFWEIAIINQLPMTILLRLKKTVPILVLVLS